MENQKKDICSLYKELAESKRTDIEQTIKEIKFFKDIYLKELLSSNVATTLEIIKTLEKINEKDKAEYLRLKAISISGIVT